MRGLSDRIRWLARVAPIVIVVVVVALFSVIQTIDLVHQQVPGSFAESSLAADPSTARYTLTSIACALSTVLAITITLALIVVELTASRYTPKLIDLFIEAKANLLLLAVFISTIIYCFYVANTITPDFGPRFGILTCLILMTLCLASLIPYIFFVFSFLAPTSIISKIQARALGSLKQDPRKATPEGNPKLRFSQSLEQISDIAKGSLRINDTSVALSSVWSLMDISASCLERKPQQPQQWFNVEPGVFLGPSEEYVSRIEQERSWVEVKVLRELQGIFSSSLGGSREVATAVAVSARRLGESALSAGDETVVELVVKHFNTFLREAINGQQKGIIYNLLAEYRSLAEYLLDSRPELAVRISHHLCYYASVAEAQGVEFVAETVAYDLQVLNRVAYQQDCPLTADLLAAFLGLGATLRSRGFSPALAGVYKMWLALGAFYLSVGAELLQEQVQAALHQVEPDVLAMLGEELLSVTEPEFWEITDRGVNFDYLDPDLRPPLREFLKQLPASD